FFLNLFHYIVHSSKYKVLQHFYIIRINDFFINLHICYLFTAISFYCYLTASCECFKLHFHYFFFRFHHFFLNLLHFFHLVIHIALHLIFVPNILVKLFYFPYFLQIFVLLCSF